MPRRVLLIVAVVLAAVIGTVSVYSYNKREEAQKAAQKKARDKTASQAVVAPVAPSGPLDHAVHDAEEARGRPAASQPAVSLVRKPTLTAEQFQGQAGMQDDGEKARRAAEQQKEFDLYSAPIFKGGNKLDAQHHGQQDGTAGQMDPMLRPTRVLRTGRQRRWLRLWRIKTRRHRTGISNFSMVRKVPTMR